MHRDRVRLWQLSHGGAAASAAEAGAARAAADGEGAAFGCGGWDPHHAHSLGLGCGRDLLTLDCRSMRLATAVEGAHAQRLRGLDFNPNKPNLLLTSGDDYHVRFWDLRKPSAPLLSQARQREPRAGPVSDLPPSPRLAPRSTRTRTG